MLLICIQEELCFSVAEHIFLILLCNVKEWILRSQVWGVNWNFVNRLHTSHLYSRRITFISGSEHLLDSSLQCQRVNIAFTGLRCKLKFCEQTTCFSFVFKNNCIYDCNSFKQFVVYIDVWLINRLKFILKIG